jgi:hypothetical protein
VNQDLVFYRTSDVVLRPIAARAGTICTVRRLHDETLTMLATTGALWSCPLLAGAGRLGRIAGEPYPTMSMAGKWATMTKRRT